MVTAMETIPGYTYVVTAAEDVTVTDSHGLALEVPAGEQRTFVATGTEVPVPAGCVIQQLRGNFSLPPAYGGGGQITVDPAPTQGSPNAVSSGGVYSALRELPAPLPTALTPTTVMKHGGVYTVESSGSALVFSAVTIEDYNAARVWVDYNGAGGITWPSWSWRTEDGAPPEFDFFHRYKITVENDGLLTRAAVDDSYATRPEYEHTVLTKTNMTDTSLELYIVPDETTQAAGHYLSNSVDMWGAFSVDKFTGFFINANSVNMNAESITHPLLPGEYAGYGNASSSHRPMITFCTSRPVSVYAVSFWAGECADACVVVQAEVDGEWVLLGGTTTLDATEHVVKPATPVTASKLRLQFGNNGWNRNGLSRIRIFEV